MDRLVPVEPFDRSGQPRDPLDRLGWLLALVIIWRLIGSC
jgi:hypothetical protein